MSIHRKSLALAAILSSSLLSSMAYAETVTSFAPAPPTGTAPTPGVWFQNDVRIGGTAAIVDLTGLSAETGAPLPSGAAFLTTDSTNAAKAEVGVANNFGVVSTFGNGFAISYSWFKDSNGGLTPEPAPSLKLAIFNPTCVASSGDCYGELIYEPYVQAYPSYVNPTPDTWTTSNIDLNNGKFWWSGGFNVATSSAGPPYRTLQEWIATLGTASSDFSGALLVRASVGVGSYNPNQKGYFDAVTISGTSADASYDFELAPQYGSVGECASTLIGENCGGLSGKARAQCNHDQQMTCFDMFGVQ